MDKNSKVSKKRNYIIKEKQEAGLSRLAYL